MIIIMLVTKLHLRTGIRMFNTDPKFYSQSIFPAGRLKFSVFGSLPQENSTDNDDSLKIISDDLNSNIFEIIWIAPFEDCDWFDDDFIFGGDLNQYSICIYSGIIGRGLTKKDNPSNDLWNDDWLKLLFVSTPI